MSRHSRAFTIATLVLTIGVTAIGYYRADSTETQLRYTVAPAIRGDVVRTVNTIGQLAPFHSVDVSSQISGLVAAVEVGFNSSVKKGQVLARIDPSTYEQKLRQSESEMEKAEATYKLHQLNEHRARELLDNNGLLSRHAYDQAAAELQQSRAELHIREAAVQEARVNLKRCKILSPIDGIVIFMQIEVGKTVNSTFSTPVLFVIAQNLTKMRIDTPINEVDIRHVHPGQHVTFRVDAFPERLFDGRLIEIRNPYFPADNQQAPEQTEASAVVSFKGVIEVDNADLALRPSLTANVSIITEKHEGVLMVPNGALRVDGLMGTHNVEKGHPFNADDTQQRTAVIYRLPGRNREAQPEAVAVQLGKSNSLVTEVASGIEADDLIVTGVIEPAETTSTHRWF